MNEPVGSREGKAALRLYLKREREQQAASKDLLTALRTTAASAFSDEASEADYIQEAKDRAAEYCQARNKNLRPVRPVDPNNRSAVEGQQAGLEFVEKRRRSVIRK